MTTTSETLLDVGRTAWPTINVSPDSFASFVSEPSADLTPRAADLYLACACAERDEAATRLFISTFSPEIDRVARRTSAPGVSPEDSRQMLLERILVGGPGRPAKIASYRGRGSLRSWVRVTAVRLLIDVFRGGGKGREVNVEHTLFDELVGAADPELAYLKKHYRDEFGRAFETAVGELPARAKNHLRHVFIEKLTIDQMAALYGVHRATAARRLAAARDALLAETRAQLALQLEVTGADIDSIMRLISSQLELSVQRIFAAASRRGNSRPS